MGAAAQDSLWTRAGAEPGVRAVVEDFYGRVFADLMIGFFVRGLDRQHLIDREVEFASQVLGGPLRYTGRPLREAHARHPILVGHFDRRQQLLHQAMLAHTLPDEVVQAWLAAGERLRGQILE